MRKFGASSRVPFSHQLDGGEFASEHGRYSAEKRKRDRDRNFAQHEMFATGGAIPANVKFEFGYNINMLFGSYLTKSTSLRTQIRIVNETMRLTC